jgi:hypothetical protein
MKTKEATVIVKKPTLGIKNIKIGNKTIHKIVCTCNEAGETEKKSYTKEETNNIFNNVYKDSEDGEARCLICKTFLISNKLNYPILTTTNNTRKNYALDHMISFSKSNNNCLNHNIVPICPICNGAKGKNRDYIDFLVTFIVMEINYKLTKEPSALSEIHKVNDYLIANPYCVTYSQFLLNELTPLAKKHQLKLVRKYFWDHIKWEPHFDLMYLQNKDFVLSPDSKNQKFLYIHDYNYINPIDFIIVNTIRILKSCTDIIHPNDENIINLLQSMKPSLEPKVKLDKTEETEDSQKIEICYSDFITNNMEPDQIAQQLINVNKYFNKLKQNGLLDFEPIIDISYSLFISNNMTNDIKIKTKEKIKNAFVSFGMTEPINDLIVNNTEIYPKEGIKNINVIKPAYMYGKPTYNYFGVEEAQI